MRLLLVANPTSFDILLLCVGTVAAIIGGLPFPLLGLLYGKLLDDLNTTCGDVDPETLQQAVQQKVWYVFATAIASFISIYTYMGCWTLFGERLTYRIRYAYLRALLRQEPAYLDSLPPGEIAAHLDADVSAIQNGTSEKVGVYITSMSYFVTAYAVGFSQDAQLTLRMTVLVPLYFAMSTYGTKYTEKFTKLLEEGVNSATNIASECLSNITLIHAFGAADRFEGIYYTRLWNVRHAAAGKVLTTATQLGFLYFIAYASNALAMWQGSKQIADSVSNPDVGISFGNVYTVITILLDGK